MPFSGSALLALVVSRPIMRVKIQHDSSREVLFLLWEERDCFRKELQSMANVSCNDVRASSWALEGVGPKKVK